MIVGTRKGVFVLEESGGTWRMVRTGHLGIPIPYAVMDPRTEVMWASQDHGHWGQKLTRSRDGGETWEEVEQPKYPESAELKDGEPATMRYIWVIQPGGDDERDRLYLGTEPGGLFVSDDGGETFRLCEGLWNHPSRQDQWFGGGRDKPGIHTVLVDPRHSGRIMVGVSVAGAFESTDGGESWSPRNKGLTASFLPDPTAEVGQDPHLIVRCPARPDAMWQQNHCGIFRTTDGGRSWENVSETDGPANFGFCVAVDPKNPDTAWVIPATADENRSAVDGAICVCRTDDGGRSWTALRSGLPQTHAYDVVFRHALDIQDDVLAFGTTTGNLFVSTDRGDSWGAVSHHLPPIYSVRFIP